MGVSDATLRAIAARFALDGEIEGIRPLPGGHINESYRVDVEREGRVRRYLLQRLNPQVFPRPELVMENVARVTGHIAKRLQEEGAAGRERRAPTLVPTREGRGWHTEPDGTCWRALPFVSGAVTRERARSPADARVAARAFGGFLRLLADLEDPPLHETIPGFHDTAARIARLEAVARADPCGRAGEAREALDALMAQRALAEMLPPLLASGAVPRRIAHNDAKLANVLLDERTGEALCVVDLDTVMPGSALFDFGDMVRSMTSPTVEDEEEPARVGVRLPFFEALVRGYLGAAGALLTPVERDLLPFAGRLLTFEQGVRFLTDHLDGDRYYRVRRPGHNLARCRTHLALLRSLTLEAPRLEAIVRSVSGSLRLG